MRRLGGCAGGIALAMTVAGCSGLDARRDRPSPEERLRRQRWTEAAQEAIDRSDWESARSMLETLIAETPRSAEAYEKLGRVQESQDATRAAEENYRKALALETEFPEALTGLARTELAQGRLEVALQHARESIDYAPGAAEAHRVEGRVLESLGRPQDALASYFRALGLDGSDRTSMVRVAAIQIDRGQNDQAVARLTHALELAPDDPEILSYRGRAQLALGHTAEAVSDLRAAVAARGDDAEANYQLALALEQASQGEEARAVAERALVLAPDDPRLRSLADRLRR